MSRHRAGTESTDRLVSEESTDRRIAVIGMAFRLPGAATEEALWRNIRAGTVSVRRFDEAELTTAGVPEADRRAADFVGVSGTLADIDRFDAGYFGISAREAQLIEPQQRIFLECVQHALEDAGYAGAGDGRHTAVYAGAGYHLYGMQSYLLNNLAPEGLGSDWMARLSVLLGNYPDFLATRTAHRLDLRGPAMSVQAACSTGLLAVHLARQALLTGEAELTVAGATAIHVPQVLGYRYVKGSILSRSGVCRPFDADADGTIGGNGVVALVLKRLDAALADGDHIHAVLLGSGVSNDGATKVAYSAPSAAGQQDALLRAYGAAGVSPETIGYLETHGTGTYKGDPIEFAALVAAFRQYTDRVGFCHLGSTKANLGHLDACSGLAGLVKAILVLRHGEIPPLANFRRINPGLTLAGSPFRIPTAVLPWPDGEQPRRAGVTALGMGGTNVHVIVEEAPRDRPSGANRTRSETPGSAGSEVPASALLERRGSAGVAGPGTAVPGLLPLSAPDAAGLRRLAAAVRRHLRTRPAPPLADLVSTAALGRRHRRHRLVATGADAEALAESLDTYLAGGPGRPGRQGGWSAPVSGVAAREPGPVLFSYPGQGTGYPGAARHLYDRFPVFRAVVDAADRHHREATGRPLRPALLGDLPSPGDPGQATWPTGVAQPALFAYQAAATALWRQLGVTPRLVTGHSVGEYAALHAAGALSLADGITLTAARAALMRDHTPPGAMAVIFADRDVVTGLLNRTPGLDLAAVNAAGVQVVAGPPEVVSAAGRHLDSQGIRWRLLPVDRAFHSALLAPIAEPLARLHARVTWTPLTIPLMSGVDGMVRPTGWVPGSAHLTALTHSTVRFDLVGAALGQLIEPVAVELGPEPALGGLIARAASDALVVPTAHRRGEAAAFDTAVARLYCAGVAVDWSALLDGVPGRRIRLPRYPFAPTRHWLGPAPNPLSRGSHPMAENPQLLHRICALTAGHLGAGPGGVDPDTAFADLGADSLLLINLVREVEREYGVRVAMRELFETADTPRRLTELILRRQQNGATVPPTGIGLPPTGIGLPQAGGPPQQNGAAQPQAVAAPYPDAQAVATLAAQLHQLAQTQLQLMTQFSQILADHARLLTGGVPGTGAADNRAGGGTGV